MFDELSKKPKPNWKALNSEYENSSETISDFCHRHGVKYSTFKNQRTKFLKQPSQNKETSPSSFTPLSVEGLPKEKPQVVFLEFPSGLKLTIQG
jgi:hypothetical protein